MTNDLEKVSGIGKATADRLRFFRKIHSYDEYKPEQDNEKYLHLFPLS